MRQLLNKYKLLNKPIRKFSKDRLEYNPQKIRPHPILNFQPVIGLEVHAQISTNSKLFSGASTTFAAPANQNVALFDAAIPGTLPVLNKACVESAVKTALALNCTLNPVSTFDRKHYFYTDLPFGYQITQQRNPIAKNGQLRFQVYTPGKHKQPYEKTSQLKQIQLEQDSGKSLHDVDDRRSLIDLNRAGIPLMEFVFEPDLSDGEEAAALVKELALILTALDTCCCKMEEGALRVDANVSIHQPGEPLGPRTEIKNIGSIRGVASAIAYEIKRQIDVVTQGGSITNETRAWNAEKKITVPMREKEEKQDYRFMPEPNLPPLHLQMPGLDNYGLPNDLVSVEKMIQQIPKLPEEKRLELIESYGLTRTNSIILVNDEVLYDYFIEIMEIRRRNPQTVANFLIIELLTIVNKGGKILTKNLISVKNLGQLVDMLTTDKINLITARKILEAIILNSSDHTPEEIVQENNWLLISDDSEIEHICEKVIKENPDLVNQYRSGKTKLFKAILGIVAKTTDNRVNMAKVAIVLKRILNK